MESSDFNDVDRDTKEILQSITPRPSVSVRTNGTVVEHNAHAEPGLFRRTCRSTIDDWRKTVFVLVEP